MSHCINQTNQIHGATDTGEIVDHVTDELSRATEGEFDKVFNEAFRAAYPNHEKFISDLRTGSELIRHAGEELSRVLAEFGHSIPSPGLTKTCTRCRESKPIDQFYRKKSGKFGVMSRCKECHKEQLRPYKERWQKTNQERVEEYRANWIARNPEKWQEVRRAKQRRYLDRLYADPERYEKFKERKNAYYRAKRAESRRQVAT